ncbi:hypothetical protein HMPREF9163_00303 [Selenomonas sp. oral taxon 138 str. F0429]|nr:hypothetical protein HMPREF9163_00303 [Selenomonas sp. oral taxon 138 str. F0429]
MHPIRKDSGKRLFVTAKQTRGSGTGNVLQEQHGVAFEQQGKATVLARKRRIDLHSAAFVAENTGTLAVDITGIKQAVRMRPDTLLQLVAVPFGRRTADRTAQRSRLVYAHMYMDYRLFLVKFCAYDILWIL